MAQKLTIEATLSVLDRLTLEDYNSVHSKIMNLWLVKLPNYSGGFRRYEQVFYYGKSYNDLIIKISIDPNFKSIYKSGEIYSFNYVSMKVTDDNEVYRILKCSICGDAVPDITHGHTDVSDNDWLTITKFEIELGDIKITKVDNIRY